MCTSVFTHCWDSRFISLHHLTGKIMGLKSLNTAAASHIVTSRKCTVAPVTIVPWPLFWFSLNSIVTLKSRSNRKWICQLVQSYEVHLQCKFSDSISVACTDNTHISIFYDDVKPSTLGQSDPVLVCDQGSLGGLWKQEYKPRCAAVTICATLVNIQAHRQTNRQTDHFDRLIWIAQPAELESITTWAC